MRERGRKLKGKVKITGNQWTWGAASATHPREVSGKEVFIRQKVSCTSAEEAAEREFREWIRRYEPVERVIHEERERREASKHRRAVERGKAFGALCEATEGLAAFAHRNGITLEEAQRQLWRIKPFHPALALPCMLLGNAWTALAAMRRLLTRRIDRAKHEAVRPAYYAQERARRQKLAAERRRVRMRHTLNPCPTRLEILDAWTQVKDSPEALLRFGGLMEDLECYVDNSLRRTDDGVIVGRRPGIKGWLQTEIPALYLKYKTVMAYKAAAKRMRQILDIRDPLPLSAALGEVKDYGADEIINLRSEGLCRGNGDLGAGKEEGDVAQGGRKVLNEADELEALRARAVCSEVLVGIGEGHGMMTAFMRRLRELTDPERVEDANMLVGWKERYKRKITVRTKYIWERRLRGTG